MKPILFFFEDPDEIAEKVAAQMGFTPEEAMDHMERWDEISVQTFRVGNRFPRENLH
ncbi:MAG: hypothetical protein ACXVBW_13995 [Bdellovibrionota bacterium]